MKRLSLPIALMVLAMNMLAIPAKRGQWKNLKLQDGTEVRATLMGDEHGHFWKAENGTLYSLQGDIYVPVKAQQIIQKSKLKIIQV